MVVFAWILWSLILFGWALTLIINVIKIAKTLIYGFNYRISINPYSFAVTIATFVFLCIYLFG